MTDNYHYYLIFQKDVKYLLQIWKDLNDNLKKIVKNRSISAEHRDFLFYRVAQYKDKLLSLCNNLLRKYPEAPYIIDPEQIIIEHEKVFGLKHNTKDADMMINRYSVFIFRLLTLLNNIVDELQELDIDGKLKEAINNFSNFEP